MSAPWIAVLQWAEKGLRWRQFSSKSHCWKRVMCGTCPNCRADCAVATERRNLTATTHPFEIHVTVSLPPNVSPRAFTDTCTALGIKGIAIDNYGTDGRLRSVHPMTSHKMRGTLVEAQTKMLEISAALRTHGFVIEREKIETVPWHPAAAARKPDQYFEAHVSLTCPVALADSVRQIAGTLGLGLSRNQDKAMPEGQRGFLVTQRSRDHVRFDQFATHFAENLNPLLLIGAEIGKPVVEFAIEDSNRALDAGWLEAGQ